MRYSSVEYVWMKSDVIAFSHRRPMEIYSISFVSIIRASASPRYSFPIDTEWISQSQFFSPPATIIDWSERRSRLFTGRRNNLRERWINAISCSEPIGICSLEVWLMWVDNTDTVVILFNNRIECWDSAWFSIFSCRVARITSTLHFNGGWYRINSFFPPSPSPSSVVHWKGNPICSK